MKRVIIGAAVLASLAVGFTIAFTATRPQQVAAPAKSASATADISYVSLNAGGAVPDQVNVIVGKTVQFNSKDGKSHNLSLADASQHAHSAENDSTYKSGQFNADEAWKVTFKEAGTFTFTDSLNPKISILIIAYQPK